ncbi:MAG: tol-pal system protein YbgF [Dokdonella sp.]
MKHGAAAALLAVAVLASSAQAQRLSLAERVQALEQQANGQGRAQGNIDLVNQIQALQSQVQTLQGRIEELQHQADDFKRSSKAQYVDLDSRLGRLEGTGPRTPAAASAAPSSDNQLQDVELGGNTAASSTGDPNSSTSAPTGSLRPDELGPAPGTNPASSAPTGDANSASATSPAREVDPAAEKDTYDAAFGALKDGRYAESARRFQGFIDQYPQSELAGNATYWLGESYYVTQNFRIALQTFESLLSRYPSSQKSGDALLKVGYCQYELKQWDQAEATLNKVIQQYPDTQLARLAQGRLRALKLEAHP